MHRSVTLALLVPLLGCSSRGDKPSGGDPIASASPASAPPASGSARAKGRTSMRGISLDLPESYILAAAESTDDERGEEPGTGRERHVAAYRDPRGEDVGMVALMRHELVPSRKLPDVKAIIARGLDGVRSTLREKGGEIAEPRFVGVHAELDATVPVKGATSAACGGMMMARVFMFMPAADRVSVLQIMCSGSAAPCDDIFASARIETEGGLPLTTKLATE